MADTSQRRAPAPSAAGNDGSTVRGTQSFVHTMNWCWRHPTVTALEVLWRWVFGVGVLALGWVYGQRIYLGVTGGTGDPARLGLDRLTVTDPVSAAMKVATAAGLLAPLVWETVRWLGPMLLVAWVVVSALGRTIVLRRVDQDLAPRPLTLMALQGVRVLALLACGGLWFWLLQWAGNVAVAQPTARGEEPSLVLYFAAVVVGSLVLFVAWSMVSWAISIAPLLAMLRNEGAIASLRDAVQVGSLRMKLVEINLVMGIVKVALVVLAMVFSACPLPFQSVTTPTFMLWWNVGVGVLYLLGSDFFHVARMVAYLRLWKVYAEPVPAVGNGALPG